MVQFFGYGINFSLSHYLNTGPICPVFELIWNWISDVTGPPGIETKVHNIITRINTRQAWYLDPHYIPILKHFIFIVSKLVIFYVQKLFSNFTYSPGLSKQSQGPIQKKVLTCKCLLCKIVDQELKTCKIKKQQFEFKLVRQCPK